MSGFLTHSPANVVRYLLINLGHGNEPRANTTNASWPIHATKEPDEPDNVITVFDGMGRTQGNEQIEGTLQEHPGIQVRVRATDPELGWNKASAIARDLDKVANVEITVVSGTVGAATYKIGSVTRGGKSGAASGNILSIGQNAPSQPGLTAPSSKRPIFVFNAIVSIRQLTT